MYVTRFDTFENETEISRMIKSLQEKSIEYMNQVDEWEKPVKTNTEKALAKV